MQVTLTSHSRELVEAALARGAGRSPEEVIELALENFAEREEAGAIRKKSVAEAVARIRESRKGVLLGDLKIKDLIHEGHKY